MRLRNIKIALAFLLAFALQLSIATAAASFAVTSFSCSPSEAVVNSLFSCSATIQNTGDAAGTLSTATLYSDSENWLENSNYQQAYGQSVDPGNSISTTFSGLRATKSGSNGFSKIMLDSVQDTYVADNNKKINIINIVVTADNSASSAAMGGTFTSSTEVTAGVNIDVSLSFTSTSGGGGGSGGGVAGNYVASNLDSAYTAEIGVNEKLEFNVLSEKHILSLINVTETGATIEVESEKQTFFIRLGETISVDLNKDNEKDISVYLKSVNATTKKATFIITPLPGASKPSEGEKSGAGEGLGGRLGDADEAIKKIVKSKYTIYIVIGIIILAVIVYLIIHMYMEKYDIEKFKKSVKVKEK